MTKSKRNIVDVGAWVFLGVGVLCFLNATHSTGEAPERFRLILSSSAVSLLGIGLMALGTGALIVLHFGEIKRTLRHH
jgi:hypothetical protein